MVIELDASLRRVRNQARDVAVDLRTRALAVDAAPHRMDEHFDSPGLGAIQDLAQPGIGSLHTVVALIELAYGDAGMVLACPGPGMAGVALDTMGDDTHRERLAAALADRRSWAFLAVTEPGVGSDATRMTAELRPDPTGGYLLSGSKRYIGNGDRASIGVVFARTGPNPLSIRAALVSAPAPQLRTQTLDMVGLRGAQISQLDFTDLPVPDEALLGRHLRPTRRGMWAAIQAFNTVRVQVAAMALGTAWAVHDYVLAERGHANPNDTAQLATAYGRICTVRQLVYRAAAEVQADRQRGHLASLAKLQAVALARQVCASLPRLLGAGALLDHPLLEKWWRDSAAFEFMEGTSTIQRLNIAQGYLKGEVAAR